MPMAAVDEKLLFVSGLTGGSVWEIYSMFLTAAFGTMIRNVGLLCSRTIQDWHKRNIIFAFIWEFTTVMLSIILPCTLLSEYSVLLLLLEITIIVMFVISSTNLHMKPWGHIQSLCSPSKFVFISTFRCWVVLYTVVAILAVDFHIFPRRFAKTETYGTSLMDTGVGLFMICHGLVCVEARLPTTLPSFTDYVNSIFSCLKKLWPFILLGTARLLSVTVTGYQNHVSEYGVHWNFFFTIAAVRILGAVLFPLIIIVPVKFQYAFSAIMVGTFYQFCLSNVGLREYILLGPDGNYSRNGLISANREGLFSSIGYLAIYFVAVEKGRHLFQMKNMQVKDLLKGKIYYLVMAVIATGGFLLTCLWIEDISRRFANLGYIFWMCSLGLFLLALAVLNDLLVISLSDLSNTSYSVSPFYDSISRKPSPYLCLYSAIDYNQLTYFLLGNLSTGLINVSINTLSTGPIVSFLIVIFHSVSGCIIMVAMKKFNIKIV